MAKEKLSINERIEQEFGIVDIYKSLDDEQVLGIIDDIEAARNVRSSEYGRARATITDKRLIVEAIAFEGKGSSNNMARYTFYYETWLNKIQDVKMSSYDANKKKYFLPGIIACLAITVILVFVGLVLSGISADNLLVAYGCYGVAALSLICTIPFLPHKYRARIFTLTISSLGGDFIIGNTKDSDLCVAISIETVDKLTLLARGIRKAQNVE